MRIGRIAAAAIGLLGACSSPGPPAESKKAEPAAVAYFKVDPSTAGTISGRALFTGRKPARKPIVMDSEEECRKLHKTQPMDESVVAGPNGALGNVFVYIKSGLEGKTFEPVTVSVKFDQRGCLFAPRVLGARTGQTIEITNSDPVTHNIHPLPRVNYEWNQGQQPGAPPLERKFARPEVMIPVKCNVHAWMRSFIGVLDNPYFAVTGEDGTFELKNVPPGEYTAAAWHERFGTQEAKVTVAASGAGTAEFTFKGE